MLFSQYYRPTFFDKIYDQFHLKVNSMTLEDLEIERKYLVQQLKLRECFIHLRKKPEYKLDLSLTDGSWHFNFCDRYDLNIETDFIKCNCSNLIYDNFEQFINYVDTFFRDFDISVLCKNFDICVDALTKYRNDPHFMKLYDNLFNPKDYLDIMIMPILEELKVKQPLFEVLLLKWIQNPTDKCYVSEHIHLYPHLLILYNKFIHRVPSYLRIKDLVEVLKLIDDEMILKLKNMNSEIFETFGDKNEILKYIFENFSEEDICYVDNLRMVKGHNFMCKIPAYLYMSGKDLFDESKIQKRWHFDFCPNKKGDQYRFCNCLKYLIDDKLSNIIVKYSEKFQMTVLSKHFEYFDITSDSQIELLDELFYDKDFELLYENLCMTDNYVTDVNSRVLQLLEKLKVYQETFHGLLDTWKDKNFICENIGSYPHLMNLYRSFIDKSTKWLSFESLMKEIDKIDDGSKVYLVIKDFGRLQEFKGSKKEVIDELLQKDLHVFEIEQFKIDDEEAIYSIPYHQYLGFDTTDD